MWISLWHLTTVTYLLFLTPANADLVFLLLPLVSAVPVGASCSDSPNLFFFFFLIGSSLLFFIACITPMQPFMTKYNQNRFGVRWIEICKEFEWHNYGTERNKEYRL